MTATVQHMPCVAVAYSGGRDSTALLHAVACAARAEGQVGQAGQAGQTALRVVALHVHHGLSPHADAWLAHAQTTCDAWAEQGLPVSLLARRVSVPRGSGLSLEAQARDSRHAALQAMATDVGAEMLLLAHHRRDQAETLLLQALRGGGVAGLAAMPRDDLRDGLRWVRPWLNHPREAIEAYIAHHGLSHIEDDSNADSRFARNRLRLAVWPALQAAFPQAEASLAASSARLADVLEPLASWEEGVLAELALPGDAAAMAVQVWATWPAGVRRESLRRWYARVAGAGLSASWTLRLADELPRMLEAGALTGHWPEVKLGLYRGCLRWDGDARSAALASPHAAEAHLCIDAPGLWPVPHWGGALHVTPCDQGGMAPERLRQITLKAREGGERFQAGPARPPRSLKKQFQSAAVPAWLRHAPLLWCEDTLLYVPGLGIDARCCAPPGSPQWALNWQWLDGVAAPKLKCEV